MNPYNICLMLFSFGSFFIGLLVWFKRQDKIGRSYFIFSIFATIWGAGFSVLWNNDVSESMALLFGRIGDAAAVFIVVTWFDCVLTFTGRREKYHTLLFILYILACLICSFSLSRWFITHVEPALNFKHYVRPGPLFHTLTLLYVVFVPMGFRELIRMAKISPRGRKLPFIGFATATLFGFGGATFIFFPKYGIMFPQHGVFLMPLYPFAMAYFLIRRHLFDLEAVAQTFQNEKLATIGLLAASVNHEIKNPLYAAKSLVDSYLESTKEGFKPKDPIELSIKISSQLSRALDVITKLNRFAKPGTDQPSIDHKASIPEALQTVLDLVSYEFKHDQIKINNQIPNNLPLIQADQRQLEEMLFNLIVNSCHAMKEGKETGDKRQEGVLTISCHSREGGNLDPRLSAQQNSGSAASYGGKHAGMTDKVRITIQDTGSGISKDQMKHLFEPFHTTKGEKGTGLGLYITKQLVERNGGKISVKSEAGKGTNFVLEFRTVQDYPLASLRDSRYTKANKKLGGIKIVKKNLLSLLAILLIPLLSFAQYAFAVGSTGIENASFSAESLAQGNAVVAQASEPAAISYNPAGIVHLPGIQFQPNLHFLSLLTWFTSTTPATVPGEKSSATVIPVPTAYLTVHPGPLLGDRVAFGIGSDSPFGLTNKFDADHPIVRYAGWRNWLKMYTIKPVVAFKITDWLSIGGGPMWYRIYDWGAVQAYPNVLVSAGAADGQLRLNFSGQHWGWHIGMLAKPHKQHQFGFYFRSPVIVNTSGLVKIERGAVGTNFETAGDAKYSLPLNFTFAYAFKPIEPTTIEFDFGYTRWSILERLFINHNRTGVSASDTTVINNIAFANKDFMDVLSFHWGANHKFSKKLTVRLGGLFYTPAVPKTSFIPAVPDSNKLAWGTGFGYQATKHLVVDVSFLQLWSLKRNVDNAIGAALGVSEDGDYTTMTNELSLSLTYKWDYLFDRFKKSAQITQSDQLTA